MFKSVMQFALCGIYFLLSTNAAATGFVSLPATGFAISGGTTAYTLCSPTGAVPTVSANNTCAVFPASTVASPISGYSLVASNTTNLNFVDLAHTNNTTIKIGTLRTSLWRNTTTDMCIVGARVTSLTNYDYDLNTTGTQRFAINDVAMGGFAAVNTSSPVSAAYNTTTASGESVAYRVGRSFTSVAIAYTQPFTAGSITGEAFSSTGAAAINTNWIDFSTNADSVDNDGTAMFYVESSCPAATYTTSRLSGSLRFRQKNGFLEIQASGFVPSTASDISY